MQALNRAITAATSRTDIVLAAFIISVIFLMILPMPTLVIDALIALNMTLGALLLMVAIYLPSPLAFSSFPAVLLVSTLFRLGISIATTRLILLNGDAGHIIETFGNFVVGGNLVVGLVVFLILTIVQFIVVTKGAERVAEVAARFSLDAMPGKQMSIDADLRAGSIDMDEARRRRGIVEKESQLYGSMDGAMKFVKGDAIAGIIIVAVNLLGGLLIGTLQRGMTAGQATHTYSILSIGDGLISQIPALLTAISAGIIVTRVTTEDKRSNVGKDIGAQVLAQPRALIIAALVAVGMGAIPGMPVGVFLVLALALGVVGIVLMKAQRATQATEDADGTAQRGLEGGSDMADPMAISAASPLILDVAEDLAAYVSGEEISTEFHLVQGALYRELGVPFPDLRFRFSSAPPEHGFRVLIFEVPVTEAQLRPGYVMVRDTSHNLAALGVPFEVEEAATGGESAIWVKETHAEALAEARITYLLPAQVMNLHVAQLLRKQAAEFIGIQETRALLTAMEERFPELVKEAHRILPVQKIAEIIQRLVSEDISIRDMRAVLEALVEWGQKEKDTVLLTEYVRISLKRYIGYKYTSGANTLPAYLLSPRAEETIRDSIRQTAAGSYLAMDPDQSRTLLDNVLSAVGKMGVTAQRPALLTSMDIRRYVRKLIERDLYDLPVLSYQELAAEINVQPLAQIDL